MKESRTRQQYDVTAGAVQRMFDKAQVPILDRIEHNMAELERRGARLPRIDNLPARQRPANRTGDIAAGIAQDAVEGRESREVLACQN